MAQKSPSRGSEKRPKDAPLPYDVFASTTPSDQAGRTATLLFQRAAVTSQAMNGFVALRLTKDLKTMGRLGLCRSSHEYATVWANAMGEAARDYAAMFGKLLKINLPGKGTLSQGQ